MGLINSGQIIAASHDLTPNGGSKGNGTPYFRQILGRCSGKVGEIL